MDGGGKDTRKKGRRDRRKIGNDRNLQMSLPLDTPCKGTTLRSLR